MPAAFMIFSLVFFFNDMGANYGLVQQNGRGYDIMGYVPFLITFIFQLGCEEMEFSIDERFC